MRERAALRRNVGLGQKDQTVELVPKLNRVRDAHDIARARHGIAQIPPFAARDFSTALNPIHPAGRCGPAELQLGDLDRDTELRGRGLNCASGVIATSSMHP